MSQHIEIEFKNLLSKNEYYILKNNLPYNQTTVEHKNHYFDTTDFKLQQQRCALRIRERENDFTLTLKEPADIGSLETNDLLNDTTKNLWLSQSPTKTMNVYERLQLRNIALSELKYFGALVTNRTTFYINRHLLIALDHSFYNGYEDYELEVEASTERIGEEFFHSLLADYNITQQQTQPKIHRFFTSI